MSERTRNLRNALIVVAVCVPLAIALNWWRVQGEHVITYASDPDAFAGSGGMTGGPNGPIVLPSLPKLARSAVGSQQASNTFIGKSLPEVLQALGFDADVVAGSSDQGWVVVFYSAVTLDHPATAQWPVAHLRLDLGKAAHLDEAIVTGIQLIGTMGAVVDP